jgi:hypothetical protein
MLLVAGGIYLFLRTGKTPTRVAPAYAYYVDEATGEELVRPMSEIPPMAGKDGALTVVRVRKMNPVTANLRKRCETIEAVAKMAADDPNRQGR